MKLWKEKKRKSNITSSVERAVSERHKMLMLDNYKLKYLRAFINLSNHASYLSESKRLAVIEESSNNLHDEEAVSKSGKSLVKRRKKTHHANLKGNESGLVKIARIEEINRQMHHESRTLSSVSKWMHRYQKNLTRKRAKR